MRRLAPVVLALVLVPAALAAGARERETAGPLSAVALAGTEISYSDQYRNGCHEIRLWNVADGSDRRVASHCFVSTSTGNGVGGVSATEARVLWLTYTGGNIREWSLWTKGPRARAKRISFLSADVDGPPPVVLGRSWEGSLPYAVGRTVVVLWPDGSRKFTLTAPDRVVALNAHSRGYAAVLANGDVLTISPQGQALREFPFEEGFVQEAVLAAPGLVVKTLDGLEIHKGGSIREFSLPRTSRFLGYLNGVVAYGMGRQLRLKRLVGNDILFRTLAPRFRAQLGPSGIVYASGERLGFTAWAFVSSSV